GSGTLADDDVAGDPHVASIASRAKLRGGEDAAAAELRAQVGEEVRPDGHASPRVICDRLFERQHFGKRRALRRAAVHPAEGALWPGIESRELPERVATLSTESAEGPGVRQRLELVASEVATPHEVGERRKCARDALGLDSASGLLAQALHVTKPESHRAI